MKLCGINSLETNGVINAQELYKGCSVYRGKANIKRNCLSEVRNGNEKRRYAEENGEQEI